MHRIVANCFKGIAFAIIFVIVWDVGFYLWRANALNQRMESIAVSMQEVVSKNNYLPEGDAEMFRSILRQIQSDMNVSDTFINAFDWNYADNSEFNSSSLNSNLGNSGNKLVRMMKAPASYGDVMVIELRASINGVTWTKVSAPSSAERFQNYNSEIIFTYTYLVPCLKYTTVTD